MCVLFNDASIWSQCARLSAALDDNFVAGGRARSRCLAPDISIGGIAQFERWNTVWG